MTTMDDARAEMDLQVMLLHTAPLLLMYMMTEFAMGVAMMSKGVRMHMDQVDVLLAEAPPQVRARRRLTFGAPARPKGGRSSRG